MGLRELKEIANQQFVRGKFSQCAQTYRQVLRLAPRDPNMHVRHAEACRRSGDRPAAIASYRAAADLLLELGCESRARGALKAALELDPGDPLLQADIARLGPHREGPLSPGASKNCDELPLLPPLESGLDPVPPPPPAPRIKRAMHPEELLRTPTLPRIHRALPAAPSIPPAGPPVLLPAPGGHSAAHRTPVPQPVAAHPPVLHPVATASNPRAPSPAPRNAVVPPSAEALIVAARELPPAELAAMPPVQEPSRDPGPRLEVRRLSPSALAFRSSPHDSWAVIRSHTPLEMHLVDDLEKLPPLLRDFPAGMTVVSSAEATSSPMH
jgi:hypothetical protein